MVPSDLMRRHPRAKSESSPWNQEPISAMVDLTKKMYIRKKMQAFCNFVPIQFINEINWDITDFAFCDLIFQIERNLYIPSFRYGHYCLAYIQNTGSINLIDTSAYLRDSFILGFHHNILIIIFNYIYCVFRKMTEALPDVPELPPSVPFFKEYL